MNCFLVDYENVNTGGLNGVSGLSEQDKVIVFYSDKAETMTFGLHRRLNESKAEISFQKVPTGSKNALDFQLCTYLGYLICQNEKTNDNSSGYSYYDEYDEPKETPAAYYIVSEDQDYAVISDYWNRKNVNVSLIPAIADNSAPAKKPSKKADSAGDIKTRLKSLLPAKYESMIPAIADILQRCKTKQSVNSELVRAFHDGADNSVPSEIYKCVKPLLSDKL